MIVGDFLTFYILYTMLFAFSNGASYSITCTWINGDKKCVEQNDPDGNMAGSMAVINNGNGMMGVGAGTPDNFNPNYQQIGSGPGNGEGNIDYQAFSGAGGGGVYVGTGYPPNGRFPQFNGNPFEFVQNFMKASGMNNPAVFPKEFQA